MGKVGRPPKLGDRYPSGKLKPVGAEQRYREPVPGALWQRMLADGENIFRDKSFGTELGRLGAAGELTPSEVGTGFRIAAVYGRFEYFHGLNRNAASPHYIREYLAEGAGSDTELVNFRAKEGRERDRSFQSDDREQRERDATAAFKALQERIPPEFRRELEDLCVNNRHIGRALLPRARAGLAIARKFFAEIERKAAPATKRSRSPAIELPKPEEISPMKAAFLEVQKKAAPHLSNEQLERAWAIMNAIKDRTAFRRAKERQPS